jgi:ABC-type transport system involved in multi-copper enzyme maturation permease subunit
MIAVYLVLVAIVLFFYIIAFMIVLLLNFGEQKSDYVWNNEVAFACNAI